MELLSVTKYNKIFTDVQKQKLTKFLDDDNFRFYVFDQVKKLDFKKDIDSFEFIMNVAVSLVKPAYFIKKQIERQNKSISKQRKLFAGKRNFLNMLHGIGLSEQNLRNIVSGYLPSDLKTKYEKGAITTDDFKIYSALISNLFLLDYDVLEIFLKMPSSYESNTLLEAGLASMSELYIKSKFR